MRTLFFPLVVVALGWAAPASAQDTLDDATIVAIFDAANSYDIETGQLALSKSRSKAVRDLAQQFINDHTAVREQGRELAQQLSVTPTPPRQFDLADAHANAMKDLRNKSGAEFDRAYLAHEVAFHEAVLDAVKNSLLPAIQNQELKAFVQQVGPAFAGHLEAARQLRKRLTA